jgi:hypothetical protein
MTLRCDCGDTLADWRGARGHVQFSTGNGHGDKGDVPDGWKDLFSEVDEDGDDDEQDDADDGPEDEDEDTVGDRLDGDTDESDASDGGRLKRFLYDDVRAIYGGDR